MKPICELCNKTFSKNSNLRKHMTNIHSTIRPKITQKFICYRCSQSFSYKSSLVRHLVNCDTQLHNVGKRKVKMITCCMCNEVLPKSDILQHYSNFHGVNTSIQKLNFDSFTEFENWKQQIEEATTSKYTRIDMSRSQSNMIYYYRCHRNGFFKSRGKNIRHLKRLGSNKINGHCPANIHVSKSMETGKVNIDFLPTHVGHSNELTRIPVKKPKYNILASKIEEIDPPCDILNQTVENVEENNFEHTLLTRKDLFNIECDFNIHASVDNAASLEVWINQSYGSAVLFYKKPGEVQEDCKYKLQEQDHLLILMNEVQLEILKKYGNDCICIDKIYRLSSYDFDLTTVMVLDDLKQGFPCMLAFSNRSDLDIFRLMFDVLKTNLKDKILSPNVFVSDIADTIYAAWCEIMGPVKTRLFCSWHVDRAWQENLLAKVKDSEQQITLQKSLRALLKETDRGEFEKMLQTILSEFDSNTDWSSFGVYFRKNYVENRTAWAHCCRQHPGLISNSHIERLQQTIRYIYVKGISIRRLDQAVNGIMKMVRDKLYERLVIPLEGKISDNLIDLKNLHKEIKNVGNDDISVLSNDDGVWTVYSTKVNEFHKVETSNPDCACAVRCGECNVCIHAYVCTCVDSIVNWNMCKHVHKLCTYLRSNERPLDSQEDDNRNDVDENIDNVILYPQSPYLENSDIDKRKEKILETFHSYLNTATTIEHCKVIEKALLLIGPTLAEI